MRERVSGMQLIWLDGQKAEDWLILNSVFGCLLCAVRVLGVLSWGNEYMIIKRRNWMRNNTVLKWKAKKKKKKKKMEILFVWWEIKRENDRWKTLNPLFSSLYKLQEIGG